MTSDESVGGGFTPTPPLRGGADAICENGHYAGYWPPSTITCRQCGGTLSRGTRARIDAELARPASDRPASDLLAEAREATLDEIDKAVTELEAPRNGPQYGEIHDVIEAARRGVLREYLDSQDGDLARILAAKPSDPSPAAAAETREIQEARDGRELFEKVHATLLHALVDHETGESHEPWPFLEALRDDVARWLDASTAQPAAGPSDAIPEPSEDSR